METRYQVVVRLLNDKKFSKNLELKMPEIAERAGVGYRWLCKIRKGEQQRPDSEGIDKIYTFLMNAHKDAA